MKTTIVFLVVLVAGALAFAQQPATVSVTGAFDRNVPVAVSPHKTPAVQLVGFDAHIKARDPNAQVLGEVKVGLFDSLVSPLPPSPSSPPAPVPVLPRMQLKRWRGCPISFSYIGRSRCS